jgi:hypothetical protein
MGRERNQPVNRIVVARYHPHFVAGRIAEALRLASSLLFGQCHQMRQARRIELPTQYGRLGPISWVEGNVVDFGWGVVYHLDGQISKSPYGCYPFDSAISSANGVYAVIYDRLGTKGLIFKNGFLISSVQP